MTEIRGEAEHGCARILLKYEKAKKGYLGIAENFTSETILCNPSVTSKLKLKYFLHVIRTLFNILFMPLFFKSNKS